MRTVEKVMLIIQANELMTRHWPVAEQCDNWKEETTAHGQLRTVKTSKRVGRLGIATGNHFRAACGLGASFRFRSSICF